MSASPPQSIAGALLNLARRRWIIALALTVSTLTLAGFSHSSAHFARSIFLSTPDAPPRDFDRDPLIPRNVWQIYFALAGQTTAPKPSPFRDVTSWLDQNPDYTHTLFGTQAAYDWVSKHFADQPDVVATFHELGSPVLRSDVLRYLLLARAGGVYSDLDTIALQPVDHWVPNEYRNRARVVVGVEYDQRDDAGIWPSAVYPVQFAQWTLAAAPGHPLYAALVERVIREIKDMARKKEVTLQELQLTDGEVFRTTGPIAWSEEVLKYIQSVDPSVKDFRDLSKMKEPSRLCGDVLVLHVNGFGIGQMHSGAYMGDSPPPEALVKHAFRGTWKHHDA